MESEGMIEYVAANEAMFRSELETLLDIPIVSQVRGAGYFYAIELQKNARDGIAFNEDEAADIVARLKPVLLELGLIARADGRGAPIIQYSPPLIAGPDEIREIVRITRESVERVWREMSAAEA